MRKSCYPKPSRKSACRPVEFILTRTTVADVALCRESTDEAAKILLRANSMVAGSEGRNPYLTQRIASSLKKAKESKELLRFQSSRLASNAAVADIKAEKPNSVRSGKLQGVAKAAVATEKPTKRQRIKALRKLAEKDPENVGLILTVVQLVIKEENVAYATTILEALFQGLGKGRSTEKLDVRYSPGLVALAVSLYRSQGWHMRARSELAKAARHWQSRGGGLPDSMSDDGNRNWKSANTLLRDAGIELLRSTDESDLRLARDAFSRLTIAGADARDRTQQKQQPSGEDDRLAAAGLVAAAATTDFAAVEPHLALLTPAETLVAGVDVDALVDAGVASVAPATSAAASRKKRAVEQQQPAAKRRRRLRKLPKDYEEGKKMDPERWLPQRDRSYYRPKGKKAKKRALESTQGGVVKEVGEMLELVGGAGAVRVEKAPAPGGGSKSKKKGKGKK